MTVTIFDDENVRRIKRALRAHAEAGTDPDIELMRNAQDAGVFDEAPEPEGKVIADDRLALEDLTVSELKAMAEDLEVEGRSRMNKAALIAAIRER
jgi:hypothetical protein